MEIKEFIEKFAEQFDDTDPSAFTPSTIFRDLDEWNSIIGLSVIGMIDDEYGVVFNAEDMQACKTVEDIFNRIQAKK